MAVPSSGFGKARDKCSSEVDFEDDRSKATVDNPILALDTFSSCSEGGKAGGAGEKQTRKI
ncbi:hypothetical protein [Nostoc sp. UHCC 0251]|uniref:hypothetical protein n=1 Tax=Nostoc sp. UHCC 0251 TaxID=3110240 RepID=UPI002B21A52E|nr:hypothetical protein [Nostoc sp. UHCC 0251]MEA5625514.1 hypothetical protein [Nostoc sp. UHCC 0251]